MFDIRNIIIIGSGPAGFTAAIYASRANLKPLMFEGFKAGGAPGGQLMLTTEVENFPGFEHGIQGPELMNQMRKQALRFGTEIISEDDAKVDLQSSQKKIWAGDKEYAAHAVIIATGASALWLGLESEMALRGRGVSSCATCDGAFFKNKKVAVVGGGDAALEEAIFMTNFTDDVTIVHRRDSFRASKIMQDRVFANNKIKVAWNSEVAEVKGVDVGKVTGVVLKDTRDDDVAGTRELACDGLFVAIGHKPNTDIFVGQLELDDKKYIVTKQGSKTSVAGVFAAGDVQDRVYRQAITAAGSGCMAALDAERYLSETGVH